MMSQSLGYDESHHVRSEPTPPDIDRFAETAVRDCYQCGKCSAGCPMAEHMDLLPNQLVRLVQMDRHRTAPCAARRFGSACRA